MGRKKALPAGYTERADGRIVHTFTVEGRRYMVYGKTVKECREKQMQKLKEIEERLQSRGKLSSVGNYLDQWLESRERHLSSATMRTYKKLLSRMKDQEISAGKFGEIKLQRSPGVACYMMLCRP